MSCVDTLSHGDRKDAGMLSHRDNKEYNQNGALEYARHYAIKHATEDIENFQFNTAIARIMEYTNALAKYQSSTDRCPTYESEAVADLLLIIAPFAPHFCEEMWEVMEREYSIFNQKWPVYDEAKLLKDSIEVAVQINGVVRDRIFIEPDMNDDELKRLVIANENVLECINGRTVKRIIVVRNRIVNIVC